MSDARTVIAGWLLDHPDYYDRPGTSDMGKADAILAALAEAGLEIISTKERKALQQFFGEFIAQLEAANEQ